MPTPKKRAPKQKAAEYSLRLQLGSDVYESTGDTEFQCLSTLTRPIKIMSKGTLTITHGNETKTLVLTPLRAKQLFFTSPLLLQVKAKQVFAGLKR